MQQQLRSPDEERLADLTQKCSPSLFRKTERPEWGVENRKNG